MYTLDYISGKLEGKKDDGHGYGDADAHMFILADEYNIEALQELALAKFTFEVHKWNWDFFKAEVDRILDTVRAVYDGPVTEMRSMLVEKFVKVGALRKEAAEYTAPFLALVDEISDFAADLVKYYGDRDSSLLATEPGTSWKQFKCWNFSCLETFRARTNFGNAGFFCIACGSWNSVDQWETV